jgi:hypothetical protein
MVKSGVKSWTKLRNQSGIKSWFKSIVKSMFKSRVTS